MHFTNLFRSNQISNNVDRCLGGLAGIRTIGLAQLGTRILLATWLLGWYVARLLTSVSGPGVEHFEVQPTLYRMHCVESALGCRGH